MSVVYFTADVVAAPNTTSVGGAVGMGAGWITSVQVIPEGTPTEKLVYVRVRVQKTVGGAVEDTQGVVWSGYVRNDRLSQPVSLPNLRVYQGQSVTVTAKTGGDQAQIRVLALVALDDVEPAGGGSVFFEAPGPSSGPGRVRRVNMPAPAAGAEYAALTVPAQTMWRPITWSGSLTTDLNVANRHTRFIVDDGVDTYAWCALSAVQSANLTRTLFASDIGVGGATGSVIPGALPGNLMMPAGHRWRSDTENIQVGDQYGAGALFVEEWAVV